MKKVLLFMAFLIAAGIIFIGCNQENSANNPVSSDQLSPDQLHKSSVLNNELARVKAATAKYHNISAALQDEYIDINLPVPNMGEHYLNQSLIDATFELEKPELLVYAPGPNGKLRLVSVEYAVPVALSPNPPEGFTGDEDHWHVFEGAPGPEDDLWTLHAWVWYHNPEGIFHSTNPRVP